MPYSDPEKRRAASRESKRRRRAGGQPRQPRRSTSPALDALRVRTAAEVLVLLNAQVERVERAKAPAVVKARTITYVARTMLPAIELSVLEERIAALEERERLRSTRGAERDGRGVWPT